MQTEDIYNLFRNNICGGPSIVFHRHHTAGKNKLREIEYGEDAKTCQKIVGFDANSLYLWAIAQELPTGPYVIRNSETNFKPEYIYNDGIATAYLEYISGKKGCLYSTRLKRWGESGRLLEIRWLRTINKRRDRSKRLLLSRV